MWYMTFYLLLRTSHYLFELISAPPVFGLLDEITLPRGLRVLGRGALLHLSHSSKSSIFSLLQVLDQDIASSSCSSSNPNLSSPRQ